MIARTEAGLSQLDLAQLIGISRTSVSNAEAGTVKPRKITVNQWALATGVPVSWLESGATPAGPSGPDGGDECARRDSNPKPSVRPIAVLHTAASPKVVPLWTPHPKPAVAHRPSAA